MIRVVLDTNVVVSAMLLSGGLPEAVFDLAMNGEVQLYVSEPILAEYEDVLRRPRRAINLDKVPVALVRIRAAALLASLSHRSPPRLTPMTISFLNAPRPHKLIVW